jgi:hypothetical protein
MKNSDAQLGNAWVVLDNEQVVDILSARKKFEQVYEYAIELYRFSHLGFEEKISIAHYAQGKKLREEIFKTSVPVSTNYMTDLYRDLIRCTSEQGINTDACKDLLEKWGKYPEYITLGHNPTIDIRKGFDIHIEVVGGKKMLTYQVQNPDGSRKVISRELNPKYH